MESSTYESAWCTADDMEGALLTLPPNFTSTTKQGMTFSETTQTRDLAREHSG